MSDILEAYILFKANPEHDDKHDTVFAQWQGISIQDLRSVKRKHKDWASRALQIRRDTYAEQMTIVDKALFKAAKHGDTKAADLLYRRFDGWNPKIIEQNNNYYNFADIVKGLKSPPEKVTHRKREL